MSQVESNTKKVAGENNSNGKAKKNEDNTKAEEKIKISDTWSSFTLYLLNNTDYDQVKKKLSASNSK